jgi:hypothetical protein
MSNCQERSGVSPVQLQLPDREKWPNTRRALVLTTQEHLDRELDKLPRREWFDRALAVHVTCDHEQQRDALTKANDAMFERIREQR